MGAVFQASALHCFLPPFSLSLFPSGITTTLVIKDLNINCICFARPPGECMPIFIRCKALLQYCLLPVAHRQVLRFTHSPPACQDYLPTTQYAIRILPESLHRHGSTAARHPIAISKFPMVRHDDHIWSKAKDEALRLKLLGRRPQTICRVIAGSLFGDAKYRIYRAV
jgi:hypothetical protein